MLYLKLFWNFGLMYVYALNDITVCQQIILLTLNSYWKPYDCVQINDY